MLLALCVPGIHAANHTAAQEAHEITCCLPNGKAPDVELLKSCCFGPLAAEQCMSHAMLHFSYSILVFYQKVHSDVVRVLSSGFSCSSRSFVLHSTSSDSLCA